MPWSLFFECWVLSQLFHCSLSLSSRGSLVLHFLPKGWYHLHIWGYWYFSWQSWFHLKLHPAWHFPWYTLHRSSISRLTIYSLDILLSWFGTSLLFISSSNCCFFTCMQISQEADKVVWYSHVFKNFPQFVVIHPAKDFGIVNKAEEDFFFFWTVLLFLWSSRCWQFDLWFLCLF